MTPLLYPGLEAKNRTIDTFSKCSANAKPNAKREFHICVCIGPLVHTSSVFCVQAQTGLLSISVASKDTTFSNVFCCVLRFASKMLKVSCDAITVSRAGSQNFNRTDTLLASLRTGVVINK